MTRRCIEFLTESGQTIKVPISWWARNVLRRIYSVEEWEAYLVELTSKYLTKYEINGSRK